MNIGALLSRATVIVTNIDAGIEPTVTSNAVGYYSAPFLIPGDYKVTVSSPGFQSVK